MKFLSKKGIVTHPVGLFLIGILIGLILAYLWGRGYIAVQSPFCPK